MHGLRVFFRSFDTLLFGAMLFLTALGLVTMYSYQGENLYFNRQLLWIAVALGAFLIAFIPDYRFLRTGNTTFFLYVTIVALHIYVHRHLALCYRAIFS
jgi:cell division protein FtsW (lipid II flippase)